MPVEDFFVCCLYGLLYFRFNSMCVLILCCFIYEIRLWNRKFSNKYSHKQKWLYSILVINHVDSLEL